MEDDFLMEVHRIAIELELLIDKYDLRDNVISMMVVGVLQDLRLENQSNMKAIYSHNIQNKEELDVMTDFAKDTWEDSKDIDDEPDIDDLLKGLGISLN